MSVQDYDIGQEVGRGGFATVYRAVERRNGKECALKVVQKDVAQKKNMLWRVRNEIQIHMQLEHPSIVKLYTHFEDEQCIYLVLELCAQGDLYKFLRKRRHGGVEGVQTITKQTTTSLNDQTQSWMRQLAEGIAYLHSKGIIHRDLKLSNILLSSAGKGSTAKIADFGLAVQLADPAEEHYTLCGTPNYIAPEVMNEDSAHSFPADLWSLGCIFFTLMVGRPPFRKKKISEGARSLAKVERVSVPASLENEKRELLLRLLNPSPQSRISAEELLEHPILQTTPSQVFLNDELSLRHGGTETSFSPPLHEGKDLRTHLFDTQTENRTDTSLTTKKAQHSADQTELEQPHGQTLENIQEPVWKHAASLTHRPQNSVCDGHEQREKGRQYTPTQTAAQNEGSQKCTSRKTENARRENPAKAGDGGLNKSTAKSKYRRSKIALSQGSRRDSSHGRTRARKTSKTPRQRHKLEKGMKSSSFRANKNSDDVDTLMHNLSRTLSLDWDDSSQPSLSDTNTDTDTAADRVLHSYSQMYGHRYTRRPVRTEVIQESATRRCARKRSMPKKISPSSGIDSLHPRIPFFPSFFPSSSSTTTISTTTAAVSCSSPHFLHEDRASGASQLTNVCYTYSMPCRHSCEDIHNQVKTQNGAFSNAHANSANGTCKNVTKRRGSPSTGRQRRQHTTDEGIVRDNEIEKIDEGARHSSHFTENTDSQSNRASSSSTELSVDRSIVRPSSSVSTKVYRVLNVREADLEDDQHQHHQQQQQQQRQLEQLQGHLPHQSSPQKEAGEVGDHSIPIIMQESEYSLASKNLSFAGLEPFLARTPWGCAVLGHDRVLRMDFVSQATCLVFWPSGVEVGVGVITDDLSQDVSDIALETRNRRHSDKQTPSERSRKSQDQRLGHGHSQIQSQSTSQSPTYSQSQSYIQGFDSFFSQTVPLEAVRTSWKDGVEGLTVYALARLPRSFTPLLKHTLDLVDFVKRRSPKIVLRVFPVIEKSLSSDGDGGSECNAASASTRAPSSFSSPTSSSSPSSSSSSASASSSSSTSTTASSSPSTYLKLAETNSQQSRLDGAQSNSQSKAETRPLSEPLSAADVSAWGHSSSSPALNSTCVVSEPVFECHLMQNGPLPDFSMTCDDGTLLLYELQKDQLTVTHDIKIQQTEQPHQTQQVDEEFALAQKPRVTPAKLPTQTHKPQVKVTEKGAPSQVPKEALERGVLTQDGIARHDPTSTVKSRQHLRSATTSSGCSSYISSSSSQRWLKADFQGGIITKTFHLKDCLSWTSEVPSFYWNLVTLAQRMLQICMDMELQVFTSRDPSLCHAPRNKSTGVLTGHEDSLNSCVQCCRGSGGIPAVRHIFLPAEELALWPPVVSAVDKNEGSKLDESSLLCVGQNILSESLQDAKQALHVPLGESEAGRTLQGDRVMPRKKEVDVEIMAGNLDDEGLAKLRGNTAQAEAPREKSISTAAATAEATSARNMSNNAQKRCTSSESQIQTGCQEDEFFRRYVLGEAENPGSLHENRLTKQSHGRPESTLTAHTDHTTGPTESHQEDPSFELFDSTVSDIVAHDEAIRNVESEMHELSVCSTASRDTTADSITAKSSVGCLQVTVLDPQNGVFGIRGVGQAGLTDGGCLRITFHDSVVLELDESASWLTVEADDVYKFDLAQLPVESYLGEQHCARSSGDAAKAKLIATGRLKYLQEFAAWMSTNVFCV